MAHHLGLEGHLSQDNINELQIFELPRENRGSNWISFHSEAFCGGSCLPYSFRLYWFCTEDRGNNIETVNISTVRNLNGNFVL